jgi:D-alanyl-D-alanine carboxypeptidase/D-alanyl-D-alanine-endopeptidase (penicillin-binding protein 4)
MAYRWQTGEIFFHSHLFPIVLLHYTCRSPVILAISVLALLAACREQKNLTANGSINPITDSVLESAHVGVCVLDPESGRYLYNYQGDKYFVPASNTKLFSLYAGLKYLGDSLVGIRYLERDSDLLILPTGDPTLLHPDFDHQPVIDFLKSRRGSIYVVAGNWKEQPLGAGWSWDDYNDSYMAERSALPVYGNVIRWVEQRQQQERNSLQFASTPSVYSNPEVNWKVRFTDDSLKKGFYVSRHRDENVFDISEGNENYQSQDVPFVTHGILSALELLRDTVSTPMAALNKPLASTLSFKLIHSHPVDSLFRPMMYRSDNFFAEQTLLMVSNERLGVMSDSQIIDTLLAGDLKGLPQKPSWVDGSGLSRYNLFSPQDFVWLLVQMKKEFGLSRMERLLPTGGTGTLAGYYKADSSFIFAKTGSLSGVICLSGYLMTKKNRLLIFSVMVNNHHASGSAIRRAIERFIESLRNQG